MEIVASMRLIKIFDWLDALNGANDINKTNDRDVWLTSCLKGASRISEIDDQVELVAIMHVIAGIFYWMSDLPVL